MGITVSNAAFYVRSGSILEIQSNTTGSMSMSFDCAGLILKRVEVFHSGAASTFDLSIQTIYPNSGSSYDPRSIVSSYSGIPGSTDYTGGIDQVESIYCATNEGKVFINVIPKSPSGSNSFLYLLVFESALLIID